jgi:hypothetical protein
MRNYTAKKIIRFIPPSGFTTPPLGVVLNSAALLDDAGIKPAGTIHTYRKQPYPGCMDEQQFCRSKIAISLVRSAAGLVGWLLLLCFIPIILPLINFIIRYKNSIKNNHHFMGIGIVLPNILICYVIPTQFLRLT